MKRYKIIVTPDAEEDLKRYLQYLHHVKKNPQAVKNVLRDFQETKNELRNIAGSVSKPESCKLRERGLKRMNFLKHNYFILFNMDLDDTVTITNVFHGLENFESKLR